MRGEHKIGDLVHIPQSVVLIDCGIDIDANPQLTIPLRIEETQSPRVGVVTATPLKGGYVRVYCDGNTWSIKNENIYTLEKRNTS